MGVLLTFFYWNHRQEFRDLAQQAIVVIQTFTGPLGMVASTIATKNFPIDTRF